MNTTLDPTAVADLDALVACPSCDALHRLSDVPDGARARCRRCGEVLMAPREGAVVRIVTLAATALILMVAALYFPFLELKAGPAQHRSSVLDVVGAYSEGPFLPLAIAVAALIVVLPALRLLAILYAIGPLIFDRKPWPDARIVYRFSDAIRPWAMAEIFIVGTAVALVKIAGLAAVSIGPAFWAFVALVLVTALHDTFMCRLTIWKTLDGARTS